MKESVVLEFQQYTQTDLRQFLIDVRSFMQNERMAIIRFYQGESTTINKNYYKTFKGLQNRLATVFEAYRLHSNQFKDYSWWELIELLENIDSSFDNLQNIHRWSRSSISRFGFDPNVQLQYFLTENQTLERVSKDILLNDYPNDDWQEIAINNNLREEDYTPEGGVGILLSTISSSNNLKLNAVVDVIQGETVYGLDVDRKLTFTDDEENGFDLAVLSYDNTITQAVDILILLKKNSNPDKPNDGIQSNVIIGGNRAAMNFPIVIRQLKQTFATDDTLQNFTVKNLEFDQDNVLATFEVYTRLGEVIENTQQL